MRENEYNISYHKVDAQGRAALMASLTEYLEANDNITFAFLFGSFKDYDDAVGFRDIDIAIYTTGVSDILDYALDVAVELSCKHNLTIDCTPLNSAPVFLRYRIFRDGIILSCKDEDHMTDIMEETVIDALDFMPLREEAISNLA